MHFPILAQITSTQQLRDSLAQAATTAAATPTQDQLTVWDLISMGSWFIMGPLALMSLLTIYIVIERMMVLGKAGREDKDFMNKVRDYV
ncbi:MAG TPA: hypothetical protein PKH36_16935, partial [Flavobacteriales bacterium]|nr:hypothetical protein [Flavobacteriales bacterium]